MSATVIPPQVRKMPARLGLLVALVSLLAAGCGANAVMTGTGPAVPVSATTVPPGYQLFTDAANHFTMAVPASWERVNPSNPATAQALQGLAAANPKLKGSIGKGTLADNGTTFDAVDTSATTVPNPSVNVIVQTVIGHDNNDVRQILGSSFASYIASLGGTLTGMSTIYLNGDKVLRVTWSLAITTPAGTQETLQETQDWVAANHMLFTVTFTGASPAFAVIESTLRVY
jgi:hypothetical protein